jgi:hypothetical protein
MIALLGGIDEARPGNRRRSITPKDELVVVPATDRETIFADFREAARDIDRLRLQVS